MNLFFKVAKQGRATLEAPEMICSNLKKKELSWSCRWIKAPKRLFNTFINTLGQLEQQLITINK